VWKSGGLDVASKKKGKGVAHKGISKKGTIAEQQQASFPSPLRRRRVEEGRDRTYKCSGRS